MITAGALPRFVVLLGSPDAATRELAADTIRFLYAGDCEWPRVRPHVAVPVTHVVWRCGADACKQAVVAGALPGIVELASSNAVTRDVAAGLCTHLV